MLLDDFIDFVLWHLDCQKVLSGRRNSVEVYVVSHHILLRPISHASEESFVAEADPPGLLLVYIWDRSMEQIVQEYGKLLMSQTLLSVRLCVVVHDANNVMAYAIVHDDVSDLSPV